MKRPRVPLLNLSGIRCRSTSKVAAQSYHKESINNGAVRLVRFSEWLSRYRDLKLE